MIFVIVSFAGSLTVLVAVQFVLTLVQSSLLRRKDDPPNLLVQPLDGILGRILCVSDVPLIGPVSCNYFFLLAKTTWILALPKEL